MTSTISDDDLSAYVDGQLEPERRIAVEAHLEQHPDLAVQVIQDLRHRNEIRHFLAEDVDGAQLRTIALGRRLDRRLRRAVFGARVRRGIAAAAMIALGWFAHAGLGGIDAADASHGLPLFVHEALDAYRFISNQPAAETPMEPSPSKSASLPRLGPEFRTVGSQPIAWDEGEGVQVIYRHDRTGLVTLFATPTSRFALLTPHATHYHGLTAVYWQSGFSGYALTGIGSEADLLSAARGVFPGT